MSEDNVKDRRRALKKNVDPFLLDGGRIQPQAVDLEESVLGAIMLEKNAVNDVIEILQPESFYKDGHQRIYRVVLELFAESEPIDILTVTSKLKQKGELDLVGGAFYISQLTNRVGSSANVEFHARIISQKYIMRELIRISSETIRNAFDETTDVFDLLDKTESQLYGVAEGNIRKNYDNMTTLMRSALATIEEARGNTDGISGVQTGFTDLDRVTSGWQRSDMVVLAARPGMGKTAFVLSMARNVAVQFEQPVAIFSLEMASVQLITRLISSETEIAAEKLRKGNLADHEYAQLHARIGGLSTAPIFIDDTPGLSVFELRAKARRLKQQHDIQMIIIDYLQLMTAGGEGKGNREQEISTISRSIKGLAKELDVPIIALSQLSRSVETRGGDKRPMLSDLRESGAIEQDADIVTFIYRPEYYGLVEWEDGTPCHGQAELVIAKHRNGSLDKIRMRFIGNLARFDNLDNFDSLPDGAGAGMMPSADFDADSGTITKSSRMNDMDDMPDFEDPDILGDPDF